MTVLPYVIRARRSVRRATPDAAMSIGRPPRRARWAMPGGSTTTAVGRHLLRVHAINRAARGQPAAAFRLTSKAVLGAAFLGTSAERPLLAAALGGWVGWRGGGALEGRRREHLASAAAAALPRLLDRVSACVLAGLGADTALRAAVDGEHGPLADAIRAAMLALDAGLPRADAFDVIAARTGAPEVAAFTAALIRAERFGTPIADALAAQATEVRARARAAAQAHARTLPVKMVFPLVFCFLPAFVVLAIVPVALSAARAITRA